MEDEATEVLTPLKAPNIKHLIRDLPLHTNKKGLGFICLHLFSQEQVIQADLFALRWQKILASRTPVVFPLSGKVQVCIVHVVLCINTTLQQELKTFQTDGEAYLECNRILLSGLSHLECNL